MGYSKRDYTTKEERIKATINKPVSKNMNKLSEYLSQPNVKAFNSICTSRMLEKMRKNINKGRPAIFEDREECQNEIEGYFKLCYDYDMLVFVFIVVVIRKQFIHILKTNCPLFLTF